MTKPRHIAVIGAGIAGIACARTLVQAGHRTSVFEKSAGLGGRMATRSSPFGGFDHGAQYFTVRDPRFSLALQTAPAVCKPWSASTVRVLDDHGGIAAAGLPARDALWVPTPGMAGGEKAKAMAEGSMANLPFTERMMVSYWVCGEVRSSQGLRVTKKNAL